MALLLLDGFSYKDIAAIVGLTESDVGVKINRIEVGAGRQTYGGNRVMTFDELMAVWRTQDAAPLHGLNETLLGLALRQNPGEVAEVAAHRALDHLCPQRRK